MRTATAADPHNLPLLSIYAEWLQRGSDLSAAIALLRTLIERDAHDTWARRELALVLRRDDQIDPAIAAARSALELDPANASSLSVLAHVLNASGQHQAEAAEASREALRINIDQPAALGNLLQASPTTAGRRAALAFVQEEMQRQSSNGDIVSAFHEAALGVLPASEVFATLEAFHSARPDLWQTWEALRKDYSSRGESADARQIAIGMTERFPLLPRAWAELGAAHRLDGDHDSEIAAFTRATDLSPTWGWALRELSIAYENSGRFDDALATIERSIAGNALDDINYRFKADLLWKGGQKTGAFDAILTSLEHGPYNEVAWSTAIQWAGSDADTQRIKDLLRTIAEREGKYPGWALIHAAIIEELDGPGPAAEIIDRALAHTPEHVGLISRRAFLHLGARDLDAADATFRTEINGEVPYPLRRDRAAVINEQSGPIEALNYLKSLAGEHRDDGELHRQIAQLSHSLSDWPTMLRAGEQLAEIAPDNPQAWGYLAAAAAELGKPDLELKANTRAFRLDPSYTFAGRNVLRAQIDQGDITEAEATLEQLMHHSPTSWVHADALLLALARGDDSDAITTAWERFANVAADDDDNPFAYAHDIFAQQNQIPLLASIVGDRMENAAFTHYGEALAWGEVISSAGYKKGLEWLKRTFASALPDEMKSAALAPPSWNAKSADWFSALRKLINSAPSVATANHFGWQAVANLFMRLERYQDVITICADWEKHLEQTSPDALEDYAIALECQARFDAARLVRNRVLSHPGKMEQSTTMRLSQAIDLAALAAPTDVDRARTLVESVDFSDFKHGYQGMRYHMLQAILKAKSEPKTSTHHLKEATKLHNTISKDPGRRKLMQAVRRAVGRERGHSSIRQAITRFRNAELRMPGWDAIGSRAQLVILGLLFIGGMSAKLNRCSSSDQTTEPSQDSKPAKHYSLQEIQNKPLTPEEQGIRDFEKIGADHYFEQQKKHQTEEQNTTQP